MELEFMTEDIAKKIEDNKQGGFIF